MRFLLRTAALLAVFPYLGVVYLLATGTASWSSIGYVVAAGALLGGLITLPHRVKDGRPGRRRGLSRGAAAALALVAIARGVIAGDGRRMHVVRSGGDGNGDGGGGARLVNRLLDEGDVAVAGTRMLFATGTYSDDRDALPPAMKDAYGSMRRDHGEVPSPLVATYLGLQHSKAHDLVLIEPEATAAAPRSAIVFLHGYAGNFVLPCWQIAHAVASLDAVTACPSTRWVGDWWSPEGEATVRRTVALLRARGIERIVLAGLSNGGEGASRLAPRMKGMFAGLILISGVDPGAGSAGVPTLIIHGTRDAVAPFGSSLLYAKRPGTKLVALDAGHFAMLVRAEETNRAVHHFMAGRIDARAAR